MDFDPWFSMFYFPPRSALTVISYDLGFFANENLTPCHLAQLLLFLGDLNWFVFIAKKIALLCSLSFYKSNRV